MIFVICFQIKSFISKNNFGRYFHTNSNIDNIIFIDTVISNTNENGGCTIAKCSNVAIIINRDNICIISCIINH